MKTRTLLGSSFLATAMLSGAPLSNVAWAEDEQPKCHAYIDQAGWTAGTARQLVKVRYDSTPLCEGLLSAYPCFSYFEERSACSRDDESLVDLFLRDARRSGQLVE